jgi:hypothetical protein
MRELKLIQETIEVPKNTGKAGLLHTLESLLELRRVQEIHIDGRRLPLKVTYKRFINEGEVELPLNINLESLSPYAVLRNGDIREAEVATDDVAAIVITKLFKEVSISGLWPVAFVSGPSSRFWDWHIATMGFSPSHNKEDAYGLPFLYDRQVDDDVLLIAAAYDRNAAIIDAQKAFKIQIPDTKKGT